MQREMRDFLPISGIYAIVNKVTGRAYIGQTINIIRRWSQHAEDLENGTHTNRLLQSDWKKYGSQNFSVQIIERCEKERLLKMESICIREYRLFCGVYNDRDQEG